MIELIEGYQFQEVIYQDISTVIYCGLEESAGLPVLVKFINAEFPTLVEIARLKHEYNILQEIENLSIAGIIKPLSLKELRRGSALVLEYGGQPLSSLINQRALELNEFLLIAIQLAEILAQLHSTCKVIHKNLKTANILFDLQTRQVKLSDFGYATRLSTENQTIKTKLGSAALFEGVETFAYISPEQTGRMNRSIDYRTDFYSLGVVFYEMLTHQLPFESTDPMELVYSHIAKAPVSPRIIASSKGLKEIPQAVSDIVMKLLAKTAEDRYQSALGLKADLEKCSQELETGVFEPFEVGKLDLYSQFVIPQKLYGRSTEVATLMSAFARVSAGATEMMLVSGYSGIGKSSLVYEVHKPIVEARGYFIKGKFDQFKRNIPYAALIQAFQELMQQLLTESVERIDYWRLKIQEALGGNGQVVINVIPLVELIIGTQNAVPQLGASESENRFNRIFQQFIKVFCQKEHPLVIFLDDLQWSDSASLKLINLLMNDSNSQYLLVIGAYRDNEVHPTHPLIVTLNEIKENKATINNIVLAPLQLIHVNQLISDTFRSEITITSSLAELIYNKTQGNPFFVSQLLKSLYQDNLLFFDFEQGCWQWNIETLQGIDISANVVELMVNQIQKLSLNNQNILKLAAEYVIYSFFSGENLEAIGRKSAPLVEQVSSYKQELGIYYIKIARQIVLNMTSNKNQHTLTGESFNEETMLPIVAAANWKTLLFCFYLFKLILAYLFKDYIAALAYTTNIESTRASVVGMIMDYEYNFYHSLTLLKVYSTSQDQALKEQYLNQVELNQETLHYRALNAPCNFLHKYELVEAEKARCLGQNDRAIEYYERAVIGAKEHGYLQLEALALELTAEFMSARGRERIAFDYLIDVYYAYQRWGATAKVLSLKQRYPKLASLNQTQATKTPSSTFGLASFDLATVIKASQALSDEIVLEKLLDKLINIVIENAGARTGMLLLQQQGQWVLVASGFADRDNIILLPPQILSTSPDNPVALINYEPGGSRIKINRFEEYIELNIPKSILQNSNKTAILSLSIFYLLLIIFILKFSFEFISFTLLIWLIMILIFFLTVVVLFACSSISLKIDYQEIVLTHELFGIRWNYPKPKPRNYINKLVFAPGIHRLWLNSTLTIWAGVHKFCLVDCNSLIPKCSETETEWLAYELSEWLGIPITREDYSNRSQLLTNTFHNPYIARVTKNVFTRTF